MVGGMLSAQGSCPHLAGLPVGGDEGGVGGRGRLRAISEHALVHLQRGAGLAAPVARVDDGVVRPHLRRRPLQASISC